MRVSVDVSGLEKVLKGIAALKPRGQTRAAVKVGFAAYYSLWVHEDLRTPTRNGQRKFLSASIEPAWPAMLGAVAGALLSGQTLAEGLREAGLELLVETMPRVPVDTGFLKSSGYVAPVRS